MVCRVADLDMGAICFMIKTLGLSSDNVGAIKVPAARPLCFKGPQ